MTKADIYSKDHYEIKTFSLREGCWVTVSLESCAVWEMYKSYQQLGSVKRQFETFWDFVHALVAYNA